MDSDPPPPASTPDAPDKEKMDQIRRRRMEKLGSSSTSRPEPSTQASGSSAITTPTKVESPSPKQITITPANANRENPFAKLAARPSPGASTPTVRNDSARGTLKRPRAEDEQENARPTPRKTAPTSEETIEEYEHRTLSAIFRITLDSNQKVDAGNHRLIYLSNLKSELEDENVATRFTIDKLDSAIQEACSTVPHTKPILDYLLPCWKRVLKVLKSLRGYATAKDNILKEAKRLCMSNCIFAVEVPELFGREANPAVDSLTPYLLMEPSDDRGVCAEFLNEANNRIDEDDTITPMMTKAVKQLSQELSKLSMKDNYKPYITTLKNLSTFPKIVNAIAADPLFQIAVSAPNIEVHSILGPFFRISPLQSAVTIEYFGSPRSLDKRTIANSQDALRLTLQAHQKDLLDIANTFVRASPESRSRMLDWFAYVVNSNHKRRAMRPDEKTLSTDGFLMNVTVVLDGLCQPFMDNQFSKVGRIEVEYLRRKPRVDIKEETKLNADDKASDIFYSVELPGTSNFISEVFFLTLAAHHYGSEATNAMMKTLDKDIKYMTEKIKELEAERPKFVGHPVNLRRFEESLTRYNEVLDKAMSLRMAVEGVLLDKAMQARSLLFMRHVTVWLLRVATQTDYTPEKTVNLPLPEEQPEAFQFLPEYVLEDIVGNFTFIFRYMSQIMISAVGDELVTLCITFLTNSAYIKNPYLKAKLVSLLFHGTFPMYSRTKGVLGDSLTSSKFSNDHLLHALMKFYIEVEQTGAHTQFYDKFNIRYEIFQVIKCIWTNVIYQQRLTQESKTNTDFFLRFVNLLLNDATFVLDEALTKFPKIHELQQQLRSPPGVLTEEERATKQEELATAEGQAQSYMQLTNETVSMMKLFTKTLSTSFTMPEIVDRVAAMLDYTLETLVGPKSSTLQVDDKKKYHFEPKTLLCEFIDIYFNLSVSENFINAVAGDGRCYKPKTFADASFIIQKYNLKSSQEVAAWEKLSIRFRVAKEMEDQDEDDLGEPPDEYVDPITATLMSDPVILPTSKQTVDRSTIRSILLSDPLDPFNRAPLKIEDVIDDNEMKTKIEEWKKEMRAIAVKARMDTIEAAKD